MKPKTTFTVSNQIIWLSSLCLGILISVPKIAERHFNPYEALVDSTLTFVFALCMWYYNLRSLPTYTNRELVAYAPLIKHLIKGLLVGIVLMFVFACLRQYLLAHLSFGPVMLMFEVRGVLINLVFYMFIHLLHQSYLNQQVNIELERTITANLWAQYELLKQQVNPHFLFNSLNTLKYMVESKDLQTVDFILKLSDFYRFTLESRKAELIQLSAELEILEAYLFLLKARFEDGILLSVTIDSSVKSSCIPPFTLQLLIENCIKHNVVSVDKPLWIRLYSKENFLVIENNLQVKQLGEASTGLGLENINQRYQHLLGKSIEIHPQNESFLVKLPISYAYHTY